MPLLAVAVAQFPLRLFRYNPAPPLTTEQVPLVLVEQALTARAEREPNRGSTGFLPPPPRFPLKVLWQTAVEALRAAYRHQGVREALRREQLAASLLLQAEMVEMVGGL